jgi:hypothetical protein
MHYPRGLSGIQVELAVLEFVAVLIKVFQCVHLQSSNPSTQKPVVTAVSSFDKAIHVCPSVLCYKLQALVVIPMVTRHIIFLA